MAEVLPKATFWQKLRFIFAPKEDEGVGFLDRLVVTAMLGAQGAWSARADDPREKQLLETVDKLSARLGIAPPKLIVYGSHVPNAASLISGSIAVGTNLMEIMTPAQVELVLAHELSHHRHRRRDFPVGVALPVASDVALAVGAPRIWRRLPGTKSKLAFAGAASIGWGATNVLIPMAHQRRCEYEADREAVTLTQRPQDMIGALAALEGRYRELQGPAADPPGGAAQREPGWMKYVRSHPPIAARIERIHQMQEPDSVLSPHTISR